MPEDPNQEGAVEDQIPESISLLRRQWLFLRQNWWDTGPLTPAQRLGFFLRGFFLVVIGCIGLAFAIAGTLGSKGSGLDAIGKLVAEYMLIPIGLLALIVVSLGCSLVIRSVIVSSRTSHGVEEP
jgi:hypothetical protein